MEPFIKHVIKNIYTKGASNFVHMKKQEVRKLGLKGSLIKVLFD